MQGVVAPKKIEGIGNELDSIFGRNQPFVSGWISPIMSIGHNQNQAVGTIGMERRLNCNSIGTNSYQSSELDSIFGWNQSFAAGWASPNMSVGHPPSQGPGTIGMERRMNRFSNGTSYLSGDSGIYSSSSDMALSSPVSNQLNTSLETFGAVCGIL